MSTINTLTTAARTGLNVNGGFSGVIEEALQEAQRQQNMNNTMRVTPNADIGRWGGLDNFDPNKPILIDPTHSLNTHDSSAQKLFAGLSRAQWEDYKARFDPVLDELIGRATDKFAPQAAAEQAVESVGTSFDNAQRGLDLEQSRLGLSLSPEQQASQERKMALARAGTATNAANEARIAKQDDQRQLMSGQAALAGLEGSSFANSDDQ